MPGCGRGECASVSRLNWCAIDSPFYPLDGVRKGAIFKTAERGDLFAEGLSGREAISETILADLMEIRDHGEGPGVASHR